MTTPLRFLRFFTLILLCLVALQQTNCLHQADLLTSPSMMIVEPILPSNIRTLQGQSPRGFLIKGDFFDYVEDTGVINSATGQFPYFQKLFLIASKYFGSTIKVTNILSQSQAKYTNTQCGPITVTSTYTNNGFDVTTTDTVFQILVANLPSTAIESYSIPCGIVRWPIFSYMLINSAQFNVATQTAIYHQNLYRIIRSMLGALGISTQYLLSNSDMFYTAYDQNTKLTLAQRVQTIQINGQTRQMIVTPNAKAYVQTYFNCSNANYGVLLENQQMGVGLSGTGVIVLEKDVYFDQILAQSPFASVSGIRSGYRITKLALSLLKDTNFYYSVDMSMAENAVFGQNGGCEFGLDSKSSSNSPNEYCSATSNTSTCDYYGFDGGNCQNRDGRTRSNANLINVESSKICSATQLRTNPPPLPELVGSRSRCFNNQNGISCYEAVCVPQGIKIIVDCQQAICTAGTTSVALGSTQVTCPANPSIFCSRKNCQDWCGGQGLCINGQCTNCMQFDPQCSLCSNSACTKCMRGYVVSQSGICQTCQNAITNCNDCYIQSSVIKCKYCADGFFPSQNTQSCVSCPNIIPNCNTCQKGCNVKCQDCVSNKYYLSDDSMSCLSCSTAISGCISCSKSNSAMICTECSNNQYPSSDLKSCKPCASIIQNCKSCKFNNGVTVCQQCQSSLSLPSDQSRCIGCISPLSNCYNCIGSKCSQCNNGYFWSSSASQCLACSTSIAQCISCSSQYGQLTCIECSQGYYVDPVNLICKSCSSIDNCKYCLMDSTVLSCTQCNDGYFYNSNTQICTPCGISNCNQCANNQPSPICSQCFVGYFYDGNKCSPCSDANCNICNSINSIQKCTQCKNGYYLNTNSLCSKCLINGCETCTANNICTKCAVGMSRSNDKLSCMTCSTNAISFCTQCSSNGYYDTCSTCTVGYVLSDDKLSCSKCTVLVDKCLTCTSDGINNLCKVCQTGYLLSSDGLSCTSCSKTSISNCQECTSDGKTNLCGKCQTGYVLSSSKNSCLVCSQSFTANCQACSSDGIQSICSSCSNGLILSIDKLVCQSCDPTSFSNCYSCIVTNNIKLCSKCINKYVLSSDGLKCQLCSAKSINNCQQCDSSGNSVVVCSQCSTGFIPSVDKTTCISCNLPSLANCGYCSSNGIDSICQQCSPGYILVDNKCNACSNNSIVNCVSCSSNGLVNTCSGCKNGYVVSEDKLSCVTCLASTINNCQSCSSNGVGNVCIRCTLGNILSLDQKQCLSCSNKFTPNCQQCSSDGYKSTCSSCKVGYILADNKLSCTICSAAGIPNCQLCSSDAIKATCSQCQDGYLLNANKMSCQSCGGVVMITNGNSICTTCDTAIANCQSCMQVGPSIQCNNCGNDFIPNGAKTQCVPCSDTLANCQKCFVDGNGGECSSCNDGYYLEQSSKKCILCSIAINGCSACQWSSKSNSLQCLECISVGKYLSNGKCQSCSPTCIKCSITSTNCTNQPQISALMGTCTYNGISVPCVAGCLSCICNSAASTTCVQSVEGYVVRVDGTLSKCNDGCSNCDQSASPSICIECTQGFVLSGSNCNQCNINCQTCSPNNTTQCITCYPGYYLSSAGSCLKCNVSRCGMCINAGNKCIKCLDGFWLNSQGSQCWECTPTCSNCDAKNISRCLGCATGYYLQDNMCKSCNSGCLRCTNGLSCDACVDGYVQSLINPTKCVKRCQVPCLTCVDGQPSSCLGCFLGYNLANQQCVPQVNCTGGCSNCPLGFYLQTLSKQCLSCSDSNCLNCQSNVICQACKNGYFLKNGLCVSCNMEGCNTCIDSSRCLECIDGYTKLAQSADRTCYKCISPCLTCSASAINCDSCVSGYKLLGWKCIPTLSVVYTLKLNTPINSFMIEQQHIGLRDYLISSASKKQIQSNTFISFQQGSTIVSGEIASSTSNTSICSDVNKVKNSLSEQTVISGSAVISANVSASNGEDCSNSKSQDSSNVLTLVLATTIPMAFVALAGGVIYKLKKSQQDKRKQGFQSGINSTESIQKTDHASITQKLESVPY